MPNGSMVKAAMWFCARIALICENRPLIKESSHQLDPGGATTW